MSSSYPVSAIFLAFHHTHVNHLSRLPLSLHFLSLFTHTSLLSFLKPFTSSLSSLSLSNLYALSISLLPQTLATPLPSPLPPALCLRLQLSASSSTSVALIRSSSTNATPNNVLHLSSLSLCRTLTCFTHSPLLRHRPPFLITFIRPFCRVQPSPRFSRFVLF